MAADLGNLESLRINDPREEEPQPEATLASMPEDLWRRIAAYVAPRDSARNLLVASGRSSSLRGALLADIDRAAAINAGLDGDALAEAVDADSIAEITEALNRNVAEAVSEAINRNVAETISDLTGDAAEAQ